ncbi:MAG: 2-hydroxyacid dehydrogenase [Terriglobales bacterium]
MAANDSIYTSPMIAGDKPKIFITRPVQSAAISEVSKFCDVRIHETDAPIPLNLLAEIVRDLDGLMPCGQRVDAETILGAPRLRVIANIGAGYDNIDLDACRSRHIMVTNTPDVLTEATADIAFTLMLAVARRVIEGDRYVRDGIWPHWQWNFLWGSEMCDKTLGLYGFGRIAQATARRGRGFGMRILYYSRHRASPSTEHELAAEFVSRDRLLRECDFLSVHVPLTPETRHAISTSEFDLMKPSAFVINTARGSIVEEEALIQALQTGRIAGAGLDVYEHEPQVPKAFLRMSNVVLMPHVGSATPETRLRMALLAAENLFAAFDGRRPPNLVNPEAYVSNTKGAEPNRSN